MYMENGWNKDINKISIAQLNDKEVLGYFYEKSLKYFLTIYTFTDFILLQSTMVFTLRQNNSQKMEERRWLGLIILFFDLKVKQKRSL